MYVLAGQVSGLRAAVDLTVLDAEALRAALVAGKRVFRMLEQAGRPWKLQDVSRDSGLTNLVAEHGCAVRSVRPVEFQEVPQGPQSAPATPGSSLDGFPHRAAPAEPQGPTQGLSAVAPVNHPRSRVDHGRQWVYKTYTCCNEQIGYDDPFGIVFGDFYIAAWHDPCPNKED